MRAQEAHDLSVNCAQVQLDSVLDSIKKAAESGAFRYLEYTINCSEMTVKSLVERGYRVEKDECLVKISWDLESVSQSRVEKDWVNHTCSIDN